METISLSVSSSPRLLRVVRCMVAEMASEAGFSEKDCDEICLAVDEACANTIRHSYKGSKEGEIVVKCSLESDRIEISVRDFGEKFDAESVEPPDLEDVKPGGLGVHMMKSVMDKVEYDCSHETGTEVHMTKFVGTREK